MSTRKIWSTVLLLYVALFSFVMWFGYPFESFDHQNYINFLADPFLFFFEPIYTGIAFLLKVFIDKEYRFFYIFLLFVVTPTVLALFLESNRERISPQNIYFWILFKSSFIGFISQRFWFAELWMTYFILRFYSSWALSFVGVILSSNIHFGIAGILPLLYFLFKGARRILLIGFFATLCFVIFFRQMDYVLFGYDYSRYAGGGDGRGFPYFSLATAGFICGIAVFNLPRQLAKRVVLGALVVLGLKVFFSDLEVYSRIFQAQIDLLLIFIALHSKSFKGSISLAAFCLCFVLAQAFFAPTSLVMIDNIEAAVMNSFFNFSNYFL